jgi:riboflavin transporter FmnP
MNIPDRRIAGALYLIAALVFVGVWVLSSGIPVADRTGFFVTLIAGTVIPFLLGPALLFGPANSRVLFLSALVVGGVVALAAVFNLALFLAFWLALPLWWVFRAYSYAQPALPAEVVASRRPG